MAALLTRMSIPPNRSTVAATQASACSGSPALATVHATSPAPRAEPRPDLGDRRLEPLGAAGRDHHRGTGVGEEAGRWPGRSPVSRPSPVPSCRPVGVPWADIVPTPGRGARPGTGDSGASWSSTALRYPDGMDAEGHRTEAVEAYNRAWDAARDRAPDGRPGRRPADRRLHLAPPLAGGGRRPAVDRRRLDGVAGRGGRRTGRARPPVRRAGLRCRRGGRHRLARGVGRRRAWPGPSPPPVTSASATPGAPSPSAWSPPSATRRTGPWWPANSPRRPATARRRTGRTSGRRHRATAVLPRDSAPCIPECRASTRPDAGSVVAGGAASLLLMG